MRESVLWGVLATALTVAMLSGVLDTAGAATTATTTRVSVASGGAEATTGSYNPSVSADGRYVAFESYASNLVANDTNDVADVFVRDTLAGTTIRVSVDSSGAQAIGGYSLCPSISVDGRYVAFMSNATNLVPNDTNGTTDVFVRDTQAGTTIRASVGAAGSQASGGGSYYPSVSADGRYVAFESGASNLEAGDETGADIFVRDMLAGTTIRVSVNSSGAEDRGRSHDPSISADGRYVAFMSNYIDGIAGIFVRDTQAGKNTHVDVGPGGIQPNGSSDSASISADGRYVAFRSYASNLVANDTNDVADVFVRDTLAGATTRVSVDSAGNQALAGDSDSASISADGRYVAFRSYASNLVPGDWNGSFDIFMRDTQVGTTTRVSVASDGAEATNRSEQPAISADGRYVTFESQASNLVAGDGNGRVDVFMRDRGAAQLVVSPIEGATRYTTAIAACKKAFPTGSDYVVIATGMNWPDALGGSALAGALNAPILLTRQDTLLAEVRAEIVRLGATKVIVLGASGAVSNTVYNQIDLIPNVSVERIAGPNRYDTANMAAARTIQALGDAYDGTAFIATGANFPDALGASPLAAAKGWPIYLANPNQRNNAGLISVMRAAGVTDAILLGGTNVVADSIELALGATFETRLAGATRYDTAVQVAAYGVANAGLAWNRVAIATGQNFPDALAGGVLQGEDGSVLLLTPTATLGTGVRAALTANSASIFDVRFLGSTGAVSQAVRNTVTGILQK